MRRCVLFFLIVLFSIPFTAHCGQPSSPAEGDTLFYRQVLFRWQQLPNTVYYQLQVAIDGSAHPFTDSLVVDVLDSTTVTIVSSGLEWGKRYLWRVRGYDVSGRPDDWQETHMFCTRYLPQDMGHLTVTIYDSTLVYPGLTLFDNWEMFGNPTYSYCVDMYGNIVWFAPAPMRWDQELLNDGTMLFLEGETLHERIRIATLNNETVWISPDSGYHHDVERLPNGNFLVLKRDERYIEVWGDTVLWRGDDIQEIDSTGRVVWNWNSFENLSTDDIDSARLASVFPDGLYDWTHGNTCCYDPVQNTIYYSARNLSRITKIDKATGEKIWSMGHRMASGEADFGDSLFWYQHAPEPQPNGNLLLYNNDNPDFPHPRSTVLEIGFDFSQPEPAYVVAEYEQEDHSLVMGDADRLPNGNTLVCAGSQSYIYELRGMSEVVWRLDTDLTNLYRAERIPSLYPQVFCVMTPEPYLELPSGPGSVRYTVYNEGTVDDTFRIHFFDDNGWFTPVWDDVVVRSGEFAVLEFFYSIIPPSDTTALHLSVQSGLNPSVTDTSSVPVFGSEDIYHSYPDRNPREELPLSRDERDHRLSARIDPSGAAISVRLKLDSPQPVQLTVTNILGRTTATLVDGYLDEGVHSFRWRPPELVSGAYFVRLQSPSEVVTRRVVVVK